MNPSKLDLPDRFRVFSYEGWLYLRLLVRNEEVGREPGTVTLIVLSQDHEEDFVAFERRVRVEAGKAAAARKLRIGF